MGKIGKSEVFFLFLFTVVLAAVFLMLKNENAAREGNHESREFIGAKKNFSRQFDFRKDSDNDGLKDWEEALWKTDPQNQDSDGDGTPDGKEVAEGRNPAVPGPDDSLSSALSPLAQNKGEEIVFKADKEVTREKKETSGKKKKKKKEGPSILSISPSRGGFGTEVKIIGSGFTPKGNTVYAGYTVIKNLPSPDGKTLTFRVEPDLPKYLKNSDYSLVYWFYVENANGLSDYGNFRFSF